MRGDFEVKNADKTLTGVNIYPKIKSVQCIFSAAPNFKEPPAFSKKQKNAVLKNIESAGFVCEMCGRCCERTDADNSVFLLPAEIDLIAQKNGSNRSDFILPLFPDFYSVCDDGTVFADFEKVCEAAASLKDQTDEFGRIHTFGWMLRRKENGACLFLDDFSKKCGIYNCRPKLCRTYPFYLEDAEVTDCDCGSIGRIDKTGAEDSIHLTESLLDRAVEEYTDLEKTQFFMEHYRNQVHLNSDIGAQKSADLLKSGILKFIVYDGFGIFEADVKFFEL